MTTSLRCTLGLVAALIMATAHAFAQPVDAGALPSVPAATPPPALPAITGCIDLAAAPWSGLDRPALQAAFANAVAGFGVHMVLAIGNDYANQTGANIPALVNAGHDAELITQKFMAINYDVLCL